MSTWREELHEILNNPPQPGDILMAVGGEPARLDVEENEGKSPFIYGQAYVPSIQGCQLGWFLHPASSNRYYGMKCILLPKARQEVIRRLGPNSQLSIKSLKVVRLSKTNTSLLCDVHEWCEEEVTEQAVEVATE